MSTSHVYQASHIKRLQASRAEVATRREALFSIIAAQQPMTVRQVFYQATVRGVVEKTETGYNKVQTDSRFMRSVRRASLRVAFRCNAMDAKTRNVCRH